jgi:hypothetical protein
VTVAAQGFGDDGAMTQTDEIVWFRTADSYYNRNSPVGGDGRITIP